MLEQMENKETFSDMIIVTDGIGIENVHIYKFHYSA